jgi:hypothetical protein
MDLRAVATASHGPCTSGGPSATVGACLLLGLDEQDPVRLALEAREQVGRERYGAHLAIGWPSAPVALVQELMDAIVYAAAAGWPDIVRELGGPHGTLARVLARMAERCTADPQEAA